MEGITRSCGLVTCTCRVLRYHTRENTLSLKGRIKHYTGDINRKTDINVSAETHTRIHTCMLSLTRA